MWAVEGHYDLLGTRFHVRVQDPAVGAGVERLLAPFRRGPCGVPGARRFSVVTATAAGGGPALYRDCSSVYLHDSTAMVVAALVAALNTAAVDGFTGLAVHAGAVALDGRVVAFPAASGEGKSTLAAACLLAGFDYVSDEALCLSLPDGAVVAYPKPLMLSSESRALLGGPGPAAPFPGASDEVALDPAALGAGPARGGLRLSDVVVLARRPGPAALEPLPPADAVTALLGMAFNHFKRPGESFRLVTSLARTVRAWRLGHDDPVAAGVLLRERLGPPGAVVSRGA